MKGYILNSKLAERNSNCSPIRACQRDILDWKPFNHYTQFSTSPEKKSWFLVETLSNLELGNGIAKDQLISNYPKCVSLVFWEKLRLDNFISRSTDTDYLPNYDLF